MNLLLVSLVYMLVPIPGLIIRYIPFRNKVSKQKKALLFSVYTVAILLDFIICLVVEQKNGFTIAFLKLMLIVFAIVMTLFNIVIIRGYTKEHLFTFGIIAVVTLIQFSISAYITSFLVAENIHNQLIVCNFFLVALSILLFYPTTILIKRTVTPFLDFNDKSYWNTIWFIPISMLFATLFANPMESYVATIPQLLGRILIGVATIFICFSIAPDYKRFLEREQLNQQIWLQKQYYAALTEKVKSERESRHNFKHQMTAIRGFIENDDKEGLVQYCLELKNFQPQNISIPYTGNAAADGVLYHYAALSQANHICFEVKCSFETAHLPDIELCTLLGNALDNAITACKEYEGERYIRIASESEDDTLAITVDNSFNGKLKTEKGKILSKKREHEEGIGIATMKKICDDHDGASSFTADKNRFEASFLLHI